MARRKDISSVLVIGAGPIVIGQACEFDYSGTQAIKALKKEGLRVILVNSNPATIMTDQQMADSTYIEPITPEIVEKIIIQERPDAILSTVGGQTALNCGLELFERQILERNNVEMIGASARTIKSAENRQTFADIITSMGLSIPKSKTVSSMKEAMEALYEIGLPTVVRPSFTLGGRGGGIARNIDEYKQIVEQGLELSQNNQVLLDQSVLGWKECELEVIRDKNSNCIIVCSIENIDPMGIHTGDSITVSPILTLTDKEYQRIRSAAIAIMNKIEVEGGANVQFALDPNSNKFVVIEMNPRVSRSSALASKVTGFPIAKISTLLSIGYTLDEIQNDITKVTPASFEPSIDYVVTKMPKFNFEKFEKKRETLSSSMQSVGEVIGVGRNFLESINKAIVSLEEDNLPNTQAELKKHTKSELLHKLKYFYNDRLFIVLESLRRGIDVTKINKLTNIDKWFLNELQKITKQETEVTKHTIKSPGSLIKLKQMGFTDERIAQLSDIKKQEVYDLRKSLGINPVYKMIDTCAAEFTSSTPYLYSSYEYAGPKLPVCESSPTSNKKIMILGGGPNRIGQGIEFDYICVQSVKTLRNLGIEAIMVNSNPETVSTDYDIPNKLYIEALSEEHVIEIARKEQSKGNLLGAMVQLGGQTSLKLSQCLQQHNISIIGTSSYSIDLAENREKFQAMLYELKLNQPKSITCNSIFEIKSKIEQLKYPVLIRPSNVLGGRAMKCLYNKNDLEKYLEQKGNNILDGPILIDSFLDDAIEIDVDAISDGESVYIGGIMEHIEQAGIHSGDSACALPPYNLEKNMLEEIKHTTVKLAKAMRVIGFINVQYAIKNSILYVLEVNPRASRSLPFVCKSTGVPLVSIGIELMLGKKLKMFNLHKLEKPLQHYSVKETVFPFSRLSDVDIILGPEMKSTGECMGWDNDLHAAFAKAQMASYNQIPESGKVLVFFDDKNKTYDVVKKLKDLKFEVILAGDETSSHEFNFDLKKIEKDEGILNFIRSNNISMAFITNKNQEFAKIRRDIMLSRICYFTTYRAIDMAIETLNKGKNKIQNVNEIQILSVANTQTFVQ